MTQRSSRNDGYGFDLSAVGLPANLGVIVAEAIRSTLPLLIEGETGTGKTYLARLIHDLGPRSYKPFVAQNCAALPDGVFEAELFGHTRGAFTGAVHARRGLIQAAEKGTLFLDEIAELTPDQQAALLDVLDQGRLRPVGANDSIRVDFRLISATNQNLMLRVRNGMFRRDLYHRCAALYVYLPPLRERRDEIPSLVKRLLESIVREQRSQGNGGAVCVPEIAADALSCLCSHPLPGNLRDLKHVLSIAVLRCRGGRIEVEHLRDVLDRLEQLALVVDGRHGSDPADSGQDARTPAAGGAGIPRRRRKPRYVPPEDPAEEEGMIREALARARGNKSEAARLMGMSRQALYSRMLRLAMRRGGAPTEPRR